MLGFISQTNFLVINILVQLGLIIFHLVLIIYSRIIKVPDRFFLAVLPLHKLTTQVFIIDFEFILLLKLRLTELTDHLITALNLLAIYYSIESKLDHYLRVSLGYLCRLIIYPSHKHLVVILLILFKTFYLITFLVVVYFDKLFCYK